MALQLQSNTLVVASRHADQTTVTRRYANLRADVTEAQARQIAAAINSFDNDAPVSLRVQRVDLVVDDTEA